MPVASPRETLPPSPAGVEPRDALPLLPVSAERLAGCLVAWAEAGSVDPVPRLADLGLGIVLPDGPDRSRGRLPVLDLGSLEERRARAGEALPVLGRVPDSVVRRFRAAGGLPGSSEADAPGALGRVATLLGSLPYDATVRGVLLRMAMRDLVRDVDLHDRTAVRLCLPGGGVARAWLHVGAVELRLDTSCRAGDPGVEVLEAAARAAFPGRPLLRERVAGGMETVRLALRLPEPRSTGELRALATRVREGVLALLAACEPARHEAVVQSLGTFGPRDSLSLLPGSGRERVH